MDNSCNSVSLFIFSIIFSVSDVNGAVDHTIAVTVTDGNDAPSFDGYVLERGGFLVSSEATPGKSILYLLHGL